MKLDDWIGETYAPKLMIAEAEKFIAANAKRPFFLYLPFIEPHVAMHPPRESVEKFPAEWDTGGLSRRERLPAASAPARRPTRR